jgi:hypothetical protein
MRRLIITTLILLAATVAITVVYFKNLNTPATHTARVMQTIPNTAALIFEFSNDNGFYDIFSSANPLESITGTQKMAELDTLRKKLLINPLLKGFFDGQHIYLSLHGQERDSVDFLITIAGSQTFATSHMEELAKQTKNGMLIHNINLGGKDGYEIYFNDLKKRFYLVNRGEHIFSGSFSKSLALQSAQYQPTKNNADLKLIPDQQNNNSLANLYVNYAQLTPLFDQFFKTKNSPLFKSLRMLPALAGLTLNYKTDALMFNGFTNIQNNKAASYLTLFRNQQPYEAKLKDIFPSSTGFSTCFTLSNPKQFTADLTRYFNNAQMGTERSDLFAKIKTETGVQINTEFNNILANEFAVLTTRYDEKLAIISVKDGSKLRPLMVNISNMVNDDVGQFKFNKLPFFLLGDALSIFSHPYFMILDNYLILANSTGELNSYKDSYLNHKLLSKTAAYTDFDNLLAERSNVAFFLHFRNIFPILRRDMKPGFVDLFNPDKKTGKKCYALSYQLSASDKNFYTNFYLRFTPIDSTVNNN